MWLYVGFVSTGALEAAGLLSTVVVFCVSTAGCAVSCVVAGCEVVVVGLLETVPLFATVLEVFWDVFVLAVLVSCFVSSLTSSLTSFTAITFGKQLFNLLTDGGRVINTITGGNNSLFHQSKVAVSQLQDNERLYDINNSKSYDHDRCLILTKTRKK